MLNPILAVASLTLLACSSAFLNAQLPATRLQNVTPAGGKIGSVTGVSVVGADLDELKQLWFSHPGITAALKSTNRFEITVTRDVPPGIYDVRAVGKHGASNPRAFAVGALLELKESDNSADRPQAIELGTTINGQCEANTVDYFRFTAKKGQRILARCETRTLDSRLEPVMSIYDRQGRDVSRSRGGLVDFSPVEDGEFTLRLHDVIYRGGADFFYRLSIGMFPHVDYVLPGAAELEPKLMFVLHGRNLPGSKIADSKLLPVLESSELLLARNDPRLTKPLFTMPAQAALDLQAYRVSTDQGVSDPVLIHFPRAASVLENEPNQSPDSASKLEVPFEVSGQFSVPGDRDWYSFEAKKGSVYWIEVISQRLGLPSDPLVLVQYLSAKGAVDVLELNDSEANIGGPEFNATHRDPTGRFEAKEDGTYLVQVRNLFSQPRGIASPVYFLSIRHPSPDFRLVALPATPLPVKKDAKDVAVTATALRRGETLPIKVIALRRDGFNGPIDLTVQGLPPGVSAMPARIEAGKTSTLIFLHASNECASAVAPVLIRGHAMMGVVGLTNDARAVSVTWTVTDPGAELVQSRASHEYVVSTIAEIFPVRLNAANGLTNHAITGTKIKFPLSLASDGEITGPLKLKAVGIAGLESAKEFELDPKSTNAVYEVDLAQQKLGPGTYTFALQGLATMKAGKGEKKPVVKEGTIPIYSTPVTFNVSAASTNSPAK